MIPSRCWAAVSVTVGSHPARSRSWCRSAGTGDGSAPRHRMRRGQEGQSQPCPGPEGQWDWCVLFLAPGWGNRAPKVSAVLRLGSAFALGASARVKASRCLPEFPGLPCSPGGVEVEAGGTGFVLVLPPHPRIAFKARADAARAAPPPAAETPPEQGRALSHDFSSTPSPPPSPLLGPLGSAAPSRSLLGRPRPGMCGVGWARSAAILARTGRMLKG